MSTIYEIVLPPWVDITPAMVRETIAEQLALPGVDIGDVMHEACTKLQVEMIELVLAGLVPDDALPRVLPYAWVFSTNYPSQHVNHDVYIDVFRRAGFLCDFDDVVPPNEPLTIYRGVPHSRPTGPKGIAWTLDMKVAQYFAHRMDMLATDPKFSGAGHVIEPTIWRATAPPESVLALFYEQNELEVVVDPSMIEQVEIIERSDPSDPDNTAK